MKEKSFLSKHKKPVIFVTLLILAGAAIFYFSSKSGGTKVDTVSPETRMAKLTVSASGILKSDNFAELSFPSTGNLTSLKVKKGDKVTNGQLLATLYSTPQSETAQAAKAAVESAIKDRELFTEANSGAEYIEYRQSDDYRLKLKQYNDQIDQAQGSYRASQAGIQNLYIKAPFDGTILDISKQIGEVAAAGTPIIKLANLDQQYFEVELDQEDFGKIKIGTLAEINLDAYADTIFQGNVAELPYYSSDTGTGKDQFVVKLKIEPDAKHPILLGMTGDADLIVEQTSTDVTVLPFDAVYTDSDNSTYIWIVENGIIKKHPVTIGLEGDIYTEIKDDLSNLTIIVPASSNTKLVDGTKAQVTTL